MAKPLIRQIVDLHRAQLAGLVEIRGVKKMKPIYEQARAGLEEKLAKLKKQSRSQSFSAHHARMVMVQATDAVNLMAGDLYDHLEQNGRIAAGLGQRHNVNAIKALEKRYAGHEPVLQAEDAAVFQRVYKGVQPSLLNRYKRSERLYGQPTVLAIRKQLSLSLLSGENVDEAVDRVAGVDGAFEGQRWRAERIVRTELTYSYGITKQRSLENTAREMPDLKKRLVATFDDRTGNDSKKLHGQVKRVSEPFIWITDKGERIEYMQPPNRPNDREIVVPWRDGWDEGSLENWDPGDVDPTSNLPDLE